MTEPGTFQDVEVVSDYPRVYGSLSTVEVEVAVNLDGWLHLTNPVYDLEQVATRQAGYSVEPYVAVDGMARAFPTSAVTSLSIKGYSEVPVGGSDPLATDMEATSRWVATQKSYTGLLWAPAAGSSPFPFYATPGDSPALIHDVYSYTVGQRRFSATVLDFDGAESLFTPVAGWPAFALTVAMVLRRGRGEWYGLVDIAESVDSSSSGYVSMRYDSEDRLQLWHNSTCLLTSRRTSEETDLVVVGVFASEVSDEVGYIAATPGRRATRRTVTPGDKPNVVPSGVLVLGRSAGQSGAGAVMQVLDVSVRVGADVGFDDLDDLVSRYTRLYFSVPDDPQER